MILLLQLSAVPTPQFALQLFPEDNNKVKSETQREKEC